jgi:hypothetical protein
LIAGQYHEILIILEQRNLDIYEYIQPLINILKSSNINVKLASLVNLGKSMNILNRYLKHKVIGKLWDIEKFSVKESMAETDVERPTMLFQELT